MRIAGDVPAAIADKEIELRSFVSLLHVFNIQPHPATLRQRRRHPLQATDCQCGLIYFQLYDSVWQRQG